MTASSVGDFELVLLLSIVRLGEDAYGVRLREEVSALRRHEYAYGAIYTTLRRLEDKKLVASSMTDPLPIRGGRSRRQYEVTAAGQRAIREAQKLATRLWSSAELRGSPA